MSKGVHLMERAETDMPATPTTSATTTSQRPVAGVRDSSLRVTHPQQSHHQICWLVNFVPWCGLWILNTTRQHEDEDISFHVHV